MSSAPLVPSKSALLQISSQPLSPRTRLMWKEMRQIAPMLILFMVILTLVLALHHANFLSRLYVNHDGNADWYTIIWGFTCLFSLTIGMSLFSTEKENKTIQMLQSLPITSGFLVGNKLWTGFLAIVVFASFGAALQLVEVYGIGRPLDWFSYSGTGARSQILVLLGIGLAIPLECFFWGAICSLLLRRTILAAIAAVACVLVCSWIVPLLVSSIFPQGELFWGWIDGAHNQVVVSYITCIVFVKILTYAAMGVTCYLLGKNWLGNSPQLVPINRTLLFSTQPTVVNQPTATKYFASSMAGTDNRRIYRSLIWQTFHQNKWLFKWVTASLVSLAIFCLASTGFPIEFDKAWARMASCLAIPTVFIAMFAFSTDHQDSNYRFFQQHTEYGRKLWACRLLPAALYSLACIIAFCLVAISLNQLQSSTDFAFAQEFITAGVLFVFSAFAVGQFSSMMSRSAVYVFADMLMLGAFLSSWFPVVVMLNGNLWLFYAPIPMALIVITWWRAPAWLADKTRFRDHVLTVCVLALVVCCTLVSFAFYRLAEAPKYSYGLTEFQANFDSVENGTSASPDSHRFKLLMDAADTTIDEGWAARLSASSSSSMHQFIPNVDEVVEMNKYPLSLIHQADEFVDHPKQARLNGETLTVLNPESVQRRKDQVSKIGFLIAAEAQHAEQNGDLDSALESWLRLSRIENEYPAYERFDSPLHLIRWSELPDQDPKLIKKAIKGLSISGKQWNHITQRLGESLHLDFLNWTTEYKYGESLPPSNGYDIRVSTHPFHLMPWEAERSTRLGRQELGSIAAEFGQVRRFAEFPDQYSNTNWDHVARPDDNWPGQERFSVHRQLVWGTLLGLQKIQDIRFAQVRMALNAWRIENGSYPDKLSDLAPEYLLVLPVDVINGGEFAYSAKGLDAKVGWNLPQPIAVQPEDLQSQFAMGDSSAGSQSEMGMFAPQPAPEENRKELIKNMNAYLKANGLKVIDIRDEQADGMAEDVKTQKTKLDMGGITASGIGQSKKPAIQPPRLPIVSWKQSLPFVEPNTPFLLPWSSEYQTTRKRSELLFGNLEGPPSAAMFCYDFSSNQKPFDNRGGSYSLPSFELKPSESKESKTKE